MTFDEWQKGDRSLSDLRGLHRREPDYDQGIRMGLLYDMLPWAPQVWIEDMIWKIRQFSR